MAQAANIVNAAPTACGRTERDTQDNIVVPCRAQEPTPHVQNARHDSEMSGPRYSILPARAVFDVRLNHTELRVLAALGTYTDREGWCFPSQKELVSKLGVARSTLCAAIKRLASSDIGYIDIRPRTSKGRGKVGNEYRVKLDLPPMSVQQDIGKKPMSENLDNGSQVTEVAPMSEILDNGPMSGQSDVPMSGQSDIAYKDERPQEERKKEKKEDSCSNEQEWALTGEPKPKAKPVSKYTSEFEAVWKLWPASRRANSDKRKAFQRHQAGTRQFGADKIHAAAQRYLSLQSTQKDDYQYCCLVEVFMNGKLEAAVEALNDPMPVRREQTRKPSQRAIPRLVYQG